MTDDNDFPVIKTQAASFETVQLTKSITRLLLIFISGMLVSGIMAFPIESELRLAHTWLGTGQCPDPLGAGHIRDIPVFWRLFDCMFGLIGALLLIPCYQNIKRLEALKKT